MTRRDPYIKFNSTPVSRFRIFELLASALVLVCLWSTTAHAASFSSDVSQLSWFHKPPVDGTVDTLATKFDDFVLCHGDEKFRDSLRAKGVDKPFLMYMRFEAIQPASCTATPHRNQVAYKVGDYCNIDKYHRDWFLLDKNGNKINVAGYHMMDPSNSGWRSFWLSRTREALETYGWNGVMMDNIDGSFGRFAQIRQYPAKYATEATYISAVKAMLLYLYTSYYQPKGIPVIGNITSISDPNIWFSYMTYLNGGMHESLFVDWSSGWRSASQWEENVKRIEKTQSLGKRFIVVAQGYKDNYSRQGFSYASYLLAANGKSSFRYSKAEYYRYTWMYSNYAVDLGIPLGPRYYTNGSWRRDFSKGYVSVNPTTHAYTISTSTR